MAYEELIYRGHYTVNVKVTHDVLTCVMGDGWVETAIVGSGGGLRKWTLNYPQLHRVPYGPDSRNWAGVSKADYLWAFYMARQRNANEPFILLCPRENKRFLAAFAVSEMAFDMMEINLCSATGILLEQRRARDVETDEDGALTGFGDGTVTI